MSQVSTNPLTGMVVCPYRECISQHSWWGIQQIIHKRVNEYGEYIHIRKIRNEYQLAVSQSKGMLLAEAIYDIVGKTHPTFIYLEQLDDDSWFFMRSKNGIIIRDNIASMQVWLQDLELSQDNDNCPIILITTSDEWTQLTQQLSINPTRILHDTQRPAISEQIIQRATLKRFKKNWLINIKAIKIMSAIVAALTIVMTGQLLTHKTQHKPTQVSTIVTKPLIASNSESAHCLRLIDDVLQQCDSDTGILQSHIQWHAHMLTVTARTKADHQATSFISFGDSRQFNRTEHRNTLTLRKNTLLLASQHKESGYRFDNINDIMASIRSISRHVSLNQHKQSEYEIRLSGASFTQTILILNMLSRYALHLTDVQTKTTHSHTSGVIRFTLEENSYVT